MINRVDDRNFLPFPSKCISCGTMEPPFVIFDVNQPWNGALILCETCMAHPLRKFFGYVKVEEFLGLGVSLVSQSDLSYQNFKDRVQDVTNSYLRQLDDLRTSANRNGMVVNSASQAEPELGESSGVEGRTDVPDDQLGLISLGDFRESLRSE